MTAGLKVLSSHFEILRGLPFFFHVAISYMFFMTFAWRGELHLRQIADFLQSDFLKVFPY